MGDTDFPMCKADGCYQPVANWSMDGYVPIDTGLCDRHHDEANPGAPMGEDAGIPGTVGTTSAAARAKASMWTPAALGEQVTTVDDVDIIPWRGAPGMEVTLECTEFTSLCPVTSQRDMGLLRITYVPVGHIVETKSLKLWLARFSNTAAFNEVLVDAITSYLFERLAPVMLEVEGTFNVRGGIIPIAKSIRYADDQDPAKPVAPKPPTLVGAAFDDDPPTRTADNVLADFFCYACIDSNADAVAGTLYVSGGKVLCSACDAVESIDRYLPRPENT